MKWLGTLDIPPYEHALQLIQCLTVKLTKEAMSERSQDALILAIEEVYHYCVKRLEKQMLNAPVKVSWQVESSVWIITIDYAGLPGELESYFDINGARMTFKRTTFEALGLYIAREMLKHLEWERRSNNKNRFILTFNI
jgi:hypothetical protein